MCRHAMLSGARDVSEHTLLLQGRCLGESVGWDVNLKVRSPIPITPRNLLNIANVQMCASDLSTCYNCSCVLSDR